MTVVVVLVMTATATRLAIVKAGLMLKRKKETAENEQIQNECSGRQR
jgi:hypothetical protein